jgi:hypothetical protein
MVSVMDSMPVEWAVSWRNFLPMDAVCLKPELHVTGIDVR